MIGDDQIRNKGNKESYDSLLFDYLEELQMWLYFLACCWLWFWVLHSLPYLVIEYSEYQQLGLDLTVPGIWDWRDSLYL